MQLAEFRSSDDKQLHKQQHAQNCGHAAASASSNLSPIQALCEHVLVAQVFGLSLILVHGSSQA